MHCSPWYVSRYCCSYCTGKWNSRIKKGFPPFPPPYMEMNGYYHHQKRFLNLGRHCHYWFNSYKFGVVCFNNNDTCNNSCYSKQGTILHKTSTKRWFDSPCHKDLWLFLFSFWFLFYFLCTCHYNSPITDFLGTFDAYILFVVKDICDYLICGKGWPFSIMSSTSLLLF